MAAIGPISAVQRVTRVRIGTARAHDVGRVHHSLPGVALHHHFIGESGSRQAKKGCHCRCSDVHDFAHRSVSFDRIRSSSRSRQWPYNQPSTAGYRIDRLTNGIEAVGDGRVLRCRQCSRTAFGKMSCRRSEPPNFAIVCPGPHQGERTPMLFRISRVNA
jgi:hypothetical protein